MDMNEASAETLTDSSTNSDESSSEEEEEEEDDDDIVDSLQIDNDDEQEDNEKLSEVIEEPEEHIEAMKNAAVFDRDNSSISCDGEIVDCENVTILRDRISSLNGVVSSLRNELSKELALWEKEREEYQILQEKTDLIALEEATAAARAAAEAYAAESPLSDNLNSVQYNCCSSEILDVNPEQTLSELTILEYEKKLAKYQDALAFSQAEKRYNMRRQLAANTYRKKLMEVERLCDEELEKIKENANCLKPLKKMISQWYNDDRCAGDADKPTEEHYKSFVTNSTLLQNAHLKSEFCNFQNTSNVRVEVMNFAPDIFSDKFNVDQIRDLPLRDDIIESENTDWLMTNNYSKKILSESADPLSILKWESSNYTLSTSL